MRRRGVRARCAPSRSRLRELRRIDSPAKLAHVRATSLCQNPVALKMIGFFLVEYPEKPVENATM